MTDLTSLSRVADFQRGQAIDAWGGWGGTNPVWQRGNAGDALSIPRPPSGTHALQIKKTQHKVNNQYNFAKTSGIINTGFNYSKQLIMKYENENNPLSREIRDLFNIQNRRQPQEHFYGSNQPSKRFKRNHFDVTTNDIEGPQAFQETIIAVVLPLLHYISAFLCKNYNYQAEVAKCINNKTSAPVEVSIYHIPTVAELMKSFAALGVNITQETGVNGTSPDIRVLTQVGDTDICFYWNVDFSTNVAKKPKQIDNTTELFFIWKLVETPEAPLQFDLKGDGTVTTLAFNRATTPYYWRPEPWCQENGYQLSRRFPSRMSLLSTITKNQHLIIGAGFKVGRLYQTQGSGLQPPMGYKSGGEILTSVTALSKLPIKAILIDYIGTTILPR